VRLQHLAALAASSALVIAAPAYAGSASADNPGRGQWVSGFVRDVSTAPASAESLLSQARAALADATDARSRAAVAGTDVTLLLRELNARRGELSPADRKVADRLLARPTGGAAVLGIKYTSKAKYHCYRHVCVHWVTKGEDKPNLFDSRDRDRIPEWVEKTGRTAELVWKMEVTRAGYRAPRSDLNSKNHGPNKKLDIYLANVGDNGLYGFCTTDDPRRFRRFSVSAYCVVDNDFSRREFRTKPIKALRVTVAHEFFHAVQYSYDWLEDSWLLEGTATWIEDQVFDKINDNRQYLKKNSPHTNPEVPLDLFSSQSYPQYGVWSFFQYLGERYPVEAGGMPKIVRDIWKYADDSSATKPQQWSSQAVDSALKLRGSNMTNAFAEYGAVNLLPATFYSEGAAFPAVDTGTPCSDAACTTSTPIPLKHLTNVSLKLLPTASGNNLMVTLDMGNLVQGAATLTRVTTAGVPVRNRITLDPSGNGAISEPFSQAAFQYATVTLTNASIRFTCWQQTVFSCQGNPLDDGQGARVNTLITP